ncbi:MAG TPA: rhodanese-like domain-containing protein [Thermoanaerobaculaceae bacterium]|nr:rhodanese-like domain-containing protein [Thermoanaerobaculaceae bacterium]HPS80219.1 rhodanese-like domain-containing protein [Thermoanaerobaculaceae bacterium]
MDWSLLLIAVTMVGAMSGASSTPALAVTPGDMPSPTMDVEAGRALVESSTDRPGLVVLDVRTAAEFAAGHLPGAVNLDLRLAEFEARLAHLDRATAYLVYCRTQNRSRQVAEKMRRLGFERVTIMAGGFSEWSRRGFPVEVPAPR